MAGWHRVSAAVLEDERAVVEIDGREIVLFRVAGAVHAFANACPHAGNPLAEGEIVGPTLVCVYHGWRFELETGMCLAGDRAARRYEAQERDGEIWIDLGPESRRGEVRPA